LSSASLARPCLQVGLRVLWNGGNSRSTSLRMYFATSCGFELCLNLWAPSPSLQVYCQWHSGTANAMRQLRVASGSATGAGSAVAVKSPGQKLENIRSCIQVQDICECSSTLYRLRAGHSVQLSSASPERQQALPPSYNSFLHSVFELPVRGQSKGRAQLAQAPEAVGVLIYD
jgi:hypothetical protein